MSWIRLTACQGGVSWVSRCNFHSFSSRVRWPINSLTSSHWLCGSSCLEREFREPWCAQDLSPSSEARWPCQPFSSSSLPDPLLLILQGPAQTSPLRGAFPDPFLNVGPPSSPWPIPLCFLHSMFVCTFLLIFLCLCWWTHKGRELVSFLLLTSTLRIRILGM